ncbi:hypothetical protein SDRG_15355 [Saprolegnia diclina VS20]|uniref:Uncharacterized protein n=1 Tax=Saprolegnia diclina (strain VS20) TaxID=1156394 RepID=T0Q0F6_SAPDV|nr:hypothetical protein SDRG_15355 [Saprolegnia diclina VS20]EQC26845.1 hypothetical protein SDRG_15355 [Saprolegnia diclina VS20]|eukprot:XP_008619747.1 hypothetical protein SDRG_15355 [Saprolegnia diclina VS20]
MEVETATAKPASSRLSYADIFQLFHAEDAGSAEKLLAEYEAVRLDAKENGGSVFGDDESSDEDGPRTPSSRSQSSSSNQARRANDASNKRPHSQISDDGPRAYGRGRMAAQSGRQPKVKKSKLMQKLTGRKNGRPIV